VREPAELRNTPICEIRRVEIGGCQISFKNLHTRSKSEEAIILERFEVSPVAGGGQDRISPAGKLRHQRASDSAAAAHHNTAPSL
jgi:hypothetical protein